MLNSLHKAIVGEEAFELVRKLFRLFSQKVISTKLVFHAWGFVCLSVVEIDFGGWYRDRGGAVTAAACPLMGLEGSDHKQQ